MEKTEGTARDEESSESEKISYEFVSDFGYHVRSRLAKIFYDFVVRDISGESACKFKPHLASYVLQIYSTHKDFPYTLHCYGRRNLLKCPSYKILISKYYITMILFLKYILNEASIYYILIYLYICIN